MYSNPPLSEEERIRLSTQARLLAQQLRRQAVADFWLAVSHHVANTVRAIGCAPVRLFRFFLLSRHSTGV